VQQQNHKKSHIAALGVLSVRIINASATSAHRPIGGNNEQMSGSPLPHRRSAACWCRRPTQ